MPVKLSRGLSEVRIARDVVAINDGACLVSADLHGHRLPYPRANQISHDAEPEIVPKRPHQARFLAGGQPGLSEVSTSRPLKPSLAGIREQIGDDLIECARQGSDTLDLVAHQRDQLRCEIHGAPLAILCGPWFGPLRSRGQIDLTHLHLQNLGLHPSAKRMGQRDGQLEIRALSQMFPHTVKVAALEEPGPRRRFLQEMNARDPEQLPTLLRQPQRLSQQSEFPIDGAVGQASGLACRDIRGETRLIDSYQPLVIEARPDGLV